MLQTNNVVHSRGDSSGKPAVDEVTVWDEVGVGAHRLWEPVVRQFGRQDGVQVAEHQRVQLGRSEGTDNKMVAGPTNNEANRY